MARTLYSIPNPPCCRAVHAVREGADAIMLSGETAYGRYPMKAVQVQDVVAVRTEVSMARYHVSAHMTVAGGGRWKPGWARSSGACGWLLPNWLHGLRLCCKWHTLHSHGRCASHHACRQACL